MFVNDLEEEMVLTIQVQGRLFWKECQVDGESIPFGFPVVIMCAYSGV
jgi:hypothetical protein